MSNRDIPDPTKFLHFAVLVQETANRSKPKSIAERKAAGKYQAKAWFPVLDVFKRFSRDMQAGPLSPGTTSIIFRFLFPEEDHKRKFGLRDKTLIRDIADSLGINEETLMDQDDFVGCPGDKVREFLDQRYSPDDTYRGNLDIFEVNGLLDQLASTSPWSHLDYSKKNLSRHSTKSLLTRKDILKSLYRQMIPWEAAVLTQIILKDLRGLLYPLLETDPTAALKDYNTRAVKVMTKENAMFAWDPSNNMNRSYRARWDMDAAAKAFESGNEVGPRPGTQIGVPKSQKGRSCKHALSFFPESSQVWAETKYDGERAQIHVQVIPSQKPRITIFSKSKRDSTGDRRAIHAVILDCLGLSGRPGVKPRIQSSVILDAEMVPFEKTKILEFWRIRRLIRETAVGVRGRGSRRCLRDESQEEEEQQSDDCASESSLTSDAEGQHLGLVFFDVMYRDGDSLVQTPYRRRREILEELIIQEPGRAMLADRWLIDLAEHSQDSPSDYDFSEDYRSDGDGELDSDHEESIEENEGDVSAARRSLHAIFARRIAAGEEGLVLKAADSEYNELKKPWVKLKKDYIEGLGDNVDLVLLGAACVPDRALELRVPSTTLTTFYIGAQTNKEETANNPKALPHFYIYFTAAYGLSRAELERLNFLIRNDDPIRCSAKQTPRDEPRYTYTMYQKLATPELMLREPIAVELYGDRFTVSEGSKEYELRWPRITKYFRRHERTWLDCTSLQDLRKQAREAMGRVAAKEAARKEAETTFEYPDVRAEDVSCHRPNGMRKRVEMWRAKVAEADKPKRSRGGTSKGGSRTSKHIILRKRKRSGRDEIGALPRKRKACNGTDEAIPSNLAGWCTTTSRRSHPLLDVSGRTLLEAPSFNGGSNGILPPPDNRTVFHSSCSAILRDYADVVIPSMEQLPPKNNGAAAPLQPATNTIQSTFHEDIPRKISPSTKDENCQLSAIHLTAPITTKMRLYPSPPTSPIQSQQESFKYEAALNAPIVDSSLVDPFFKDALFWVPSLKKSQPSLPSIRPIVESGIRVNGLDAFLGACRWNPRKYNPVQPPPSRGIVFVDLEDEDEPRVSIWIFNRRSEVEAGKDPRLQALHVFR
ncbi:hypothetical protein DFJ43DRAFT_1077544 [Lentinula guzmanii]|uniref:ATP-dependent DNA ligase family profile domain-containing protein n=1 Tax=Lentinula guzmanii TaxID=2804957 RepID=A0AA38MZE6_9AGAR|nr:hypothetical protein DFJ43DRAFT_1077544 [Lentinula guzmanii]